TRVLTFSPRFASCSARPDCSALPSAVATRRPPKTRPMMRASTITANSRRDTGQSDKFSSRERVGLSSVAFGARLLAAPARARGLAAPWLPIPTVLAGHALFTSRSAYRTRLGVPRDQPPPVAPLSSGHCSPVGYLRSGKRGPTWQSSAFVHSDNAHVPS